MKTLKQITTDAERKIFGEVLATEVSPRGILGLGAVGLFYLSGCGGLNELDILGAGMQVGARTNPNLTYKERVGADFTGSLLREGGARQYDRELSEEEGRSHQELPEGVYRKNGRLHLAPGYSWLNPGDPNDTRAIPTEEYLMRNKK